MKDWMNGIQAEARSASSRSLVCFSFQDQKDVIPYQLEMLKNNPVPHLLTCDVLKMDATTRIQYDVTSLLPLSKCFERREIGKQDLLEMLKGLLELFGVLEDYLLDWEGIVLDSRYIYCSPGENVLHFIYLPARQAASTAVEDLKELLLQWVVKEMRFNDETPDNYIQKLLETLKAQDFSVDRLKEYTRSLRSDAIQQDDTESQEKDKARQQADKVGEAFPKPSMPISKDPRDNRSIPKPPLGAGPKSLERTAAQVKEKPMPSGCQKIKVYPMKSYILLGCDLAGLLLLLIMLLLTGSFNPDQPDWLTSLIGFLLIGGAVTYLVCSKVFGEDKKILKEVPARPEKPAAPERLYSQLKPIIPERISPQTKPAPERISSQTKPVPSERISPQTKQVLSERFSPQTKPVPARPYSEGTYVNQAIRQSVPPPPDQPQESGSARISYMEAASASETKADKTVLLSEKNMAVPVLKRLSPLSETIPMHQWPFMVGRLKEQVDYCLTNPAIGKLHAEFTQREKQYAITDMNTLNGTFVNGQRVEGGSETPLKNGDRIMLANEEFVFCTPRE